MIRLRSLTKLFRANLFPIFLTAVVFIVCRANYTLGTFLTGWDTLHPEFNFKMYWGRMLNSVWQYHQGLGAVASQAHASEIPHVLILQLLNLFFAMSFLRYAYAFLMLLLGVLGVYFFVTQVFESKSVVGIKFAAFLAALFYLFNLGTLQHFYVPLEMFLVHYGLLPWVFLLAYRYIVFGTRRIFGFFLLASMLILPQSHTPTLFYVFFVNLALYVAILFFQTPSKIFFKRVIFVVLTTFLLNCFWMLPNLYFVINHGREISLSKIHHLFSEEAFLQNKEFGRVEDVALLKNFLFNWGEYKGNNVFGDLLDLWKLHLSLPNVVTLGYLFFVLVIAGLIWGLVAKNRVVIAMLPLFLLSMFFLFNSNAPFGIGTLFGLIQERFPLFKETFRFPFTKFSILLLFCYVVYFSYFFISVFDLFSIRRPRLAKIIMFSSTLLFSLLFYTYTKPMFHGYLISPSMRVKIPDRYFQLFSYLNSQKEWGRVADLPIHSFWGWSYYNWDPASKTGYQGAGFLWFGIKQPLLNREFDRWNIINEHYYQEMSTAVYAEDASALRRVLVKYNIRWLLLDKSILAPGADEKELFYTNLETLFKNSPEIKLVRDFGEGLYLYQYFPPDDFTQVKKLYSFVYTTDSTFKEQVDPIYSEYGDYVNLGHSNYPYIGKNTFDEAYVSPNLTSTEDAIYFDIPTPAIFGKNVAIKTSVDLLFYINNSDLHVKYLDAPTIDLIVAKNIVLTEDQKYVIKMGDTSLTWLQNSETQKFPVFVDPATPLKIEIYKMSLLDNKKLNWLVANERCSSVEGGSMYGISYLPDGFTLMSSDVIGCATFDLRSLFGISALPKIIATKASITSENATANVCLLDTVTGLCINKSLPDKSILSEISDPLGNYALRFLAQNFADNTEGVTKTSGSVKVNHLRFYTGEYLSGIVLPARGQLHTSRLKIDKDSAMANNVTKLPSNPRVCNSGERRNFNTTVTVIEDFIRYRSVGDSLCDSFQFPLASHAEGYLVEVVSRNLEGMPLRLCLTNEYSKRCDLYVSLGTSKNFNSSYFFIPPMGKGTGYTFNFSNLIFGEGTSENDLKYISLTPVPFNALKSLHTPPSTSNGEALYVLNEAYEKGWILLCGLSVCKAEHVKVNNWANGWIFPDGNIPETVQVFFYPQLLQYIGFALIAVIPLLYKKA